MYSIRKQYMWYSLPPLSEESSHYRSLWVEYAYPWLEEGFQVLNHDERFLENYSGWKNKPNKNFLLK